MKNLYYLIDPSKMCWPAWIYIFAYIVTFVTSITYYGIYKKTLCSNVTFDTETIETCIVECTTFNYIYNFGMMVVWALVINLICKFGSYIGWFISLCLALFSLIPIWFIIKTLRDKTAKQKELKCD